MDAKSLDKGAQNTAEHVYVRKIQQTLLDVKIQPLTWEVQKALIARCSMFFFLSLRQWDALICLTTSVLFVTLCRHSFDHGHNAHLF